MEKNKVQNDKVQPDGEISNEDLDKVAGGIVISGGSYLSETSGRKSKDVIKLNCVNDK